MSYSLHRYASGHAEKLARFVVPIAARTYARWVDDEAAIRWAGTEHGVQAWQARLDDSATHVLAYERPDGSIAACAFIRLRAETAFLGGLYVADVGCGLGRRLLDERLRIGREAGALSAVMLIREANTPARILAHKAGFEAVDHDPCGRLSTVPRLVYRKRLDAAVAVPA